MVRAVRPGGRVVLEDDDHNILRLWPESSGFLELWRAYATIYSKLGNDPHVGRRLVALLYEAGASPARNTWIFFGACSGDALFPMVTENMARVVRGARDSVIATGFTDAAGFDRTLEAFAEWSRRPDAAFWYAICWAEGQRP